MKNFLKTYFSDYGYLIYKLIIGIIMAIPIGLWTPFSPTTFLIGYVLSDPPVYYFMIYLPKKKKELRNPVHELILGEIKFIMHLEKLSMTKELDLKTSRWQTSGK